LLVSILVGVDATAVYKRGPGALPLVGIIFTSLTHTHVSYFPTLSVTPHHTTTFNHTSWVSSATITTTTRALPTAVPSKAPAVLAVPVSVALNITVAPVAPVAPVALVVLEDSAVLAATREDLDLADLRVDLAVPGVTTEAREAQVDLADLMADLEALEEIMVDLEVPVALAVTREVYVYPSLIDGRTFADVRIAWWLVKG
jgi:hypothetical protein